VVAVLKSSVYVASGKWRILRSNETFKAALYQCLITRHESKHGRERDR